MASCGLGAEVAGRVAALLEDTRAATRLGPQELLHLDVGEHRSRVGPVLGDVSAAVRTGVR